LTQSSLKYWGAEALQINLVNVSHGGFTTHTPPSTIAAATKQ